MGVPGPVTSGLSAGVHELLRGEAVLVTDAAEVVELVGDIGELAPDAARAGAAAGPAGSGAARVLDALPARGPADGGRSPGRPGPPTDEALGRLYELHHLGFVERHGDGWKLTAAMTPPVPRRDGADRGVRLTGDATRMISPDGTEGEAEPEGRQRIPHPRTPSATPPPSRNRDAAVTLRSQGFRHDDAQRTRHPPVHGRTAQGDECPSTPPGPTARRPPAARDGGACGRPRPRRSTSCGGRTRRRVTSGCGSS